jgi:twinkle protein
MQGSSLVSKGPCPNCPSSDAYALYDDGHGHCFSCGVTVQSDESFTKREQKGKMDNALLTGLTFRDLSRRGVDESTCRYYGYGIAEDRGRPVQVAPYHDAAGELVAQKARTPDKDFYVLGDLKKARLFGQHLWRTGGKMVVVTEGEIDALSVAQAMHCKWAVVSVPNGAQGAAKALKAQLEWLSSYDKIILWFDNDDAGRKATNECVKFLPPGKAAIIAAPEGLKDANDVLRELGAQKVAQMVWEAQVYRPGGIVAGSEITLDDLMSEPELGWQTPFPKVNELTRGIHPGEVWLMTAGSGVGKSTASREMLHKAVSDGIRCGAVFLEENKTTTAKALIALDNNVPFAKLRENPKLLTQDQWGASHARLIAGGNYYAYDHFGSVESDALMSRIEYLAVSCECRLIFLDHVSIAVSGLELDEGERRALDVLMTRLRSLAERTRVAIIAVSHLRKTSEGRGFEEGAKINLDSLRGSGSLKQLSDTVIALERDTQAEGEESNLTTVRVLKCRFTGQTGVAGYLLWNPETGRLVQHEPSDFKDESADY